MDEISASGTMGSRKRMLSITTDESISGRTKRPRVSAISTDLQRQVLRRTPSISAFDRLPSARSLYDDSFDSPSIPQHARPLSVGSSFTGSRAGSPGSESSAYISRSGLALMRSLSSASVRSASPSVPTYPESSAKYYLRNTRVTIDYSVHTPDATAAEGASPLSCSSQNVLLFSRGNRIHYKNITTSEDVGQLCKLQESHGDLKLIECGGADQPEIVAVGTTKGLIHIWDIRAKRLTASWSTRGVSAFCWNGPVLTVGGLKGAIRHYDTRIAPSSKMKEQARKVTRHQARITTLSWNIDGKLLASGDDSGTVYCWDAREKVPLDVGEFIQRRKKMQHMGSVSATAWCPWQAKMLATGDAKGTVHLWNVNTSSPHSNALMPGKLDLGSPITGLHFSPHCKEFLTTHSTDPNAEDPASCQSWPRTGVANSIAVHAFPSLRHVTTLSLTEKPIRGCVLTANGTKIVLATPADNKLHVCDIWAKRKEVKKPPSFYQSGLIR